MTLDETLVKTTESNKDILKRHKNKIDEIMDTSEERLNFKQFHRDDNDYSVKKYKKHSSDDKDSDDI